MTVLADLVQSSRILVCVGAGGVGKTTVSAALGLAGALRGRRAMVLTIDPARQLARALGLSELGLLPRRVELTEVSSSEDPNERPRAGERPAEGGELHASMLDQKGAWDAFIARHFPEREQQERLLANRFYRRLSASFAGAMEFLAIEELCHLSESGDYDLLVIDTPPAGHALDFFRAPDRVQQLFHPELLSWIHRSSTLVPRGLGEGALIERWIGFLLPWIGEGTWQQMIAFVGMLQAAFGDLALRAHRARELLSLPDAACVLVSGPDERSTRQAAELGDAIGGMGIRLAATVMNRLIDLPGTSEELDAAVSLLSGGPHRPDLVHWLNDAWWERRRLALAQRLRVSEFTQQSFGGNLVPVVELGHDAHSLADLRCVALRLGALD